VAERSFGIGAKEIEPLDRAGQLAMLHQRLVQFGLMPRRSSPQVLEGPFRTFATCLRTTYRPPSSYPEPLRLVLVDHSKLDADVNRRLVEQTVEGWKRWAPSLVFSPGAGNHMTTLKSPHVQTLAAFLTADRKSKGRPGRRID
jgi:arthrofactin-type cyclic lipopeptide synthetase C